MRTVSEVLALAREIDSPEVSRTEVYYGPRGGRHLRYTERYKELLHILFEEDPIFRCAHCGEMVCYGDLEAWICDFDDLEGGLECSLCYGEEMGDDL